MQPTTMIFVLMMQLLASSIDFYIPPVLNSFDEAVNTCESYGENLISIHSGDDFQAAIIACKAMVESFPIPTHNYSDYMVADGCWIGLTANSGNGFSFQWTDNTNIDFGFNNETNPWAPNKPSKTDNNYQKCVSLSSKSPANYQWNDIPCYYLQYPLCSQTQTQTQTTTKQSTEESQSIIPYCDGVLYRDADINDILFDPTGVCLVGYDEQNNRQLSTMLQCNQQGTDVIYNVFTNTDCSGSIIQSLSYVKDDIPSMLGWEQYSNYSIFCTKTPCDYGILRSYPTDNCNVSYKTANDKYSDSVLVLNDIWRIVSDSEYMVHTECHDGQSIDGYSFDAFGEKQSETIIDGECYDFSAFGGQITQTKILCGTAIITPFTNTDSDTDNDDSHSNKNHKLIILLVVAIIVAVFIGVACFIAIRTRLNMMKTDIAEKSINFVKASFDDVDSQTKIDVMMT